MRLIREHMTRCGWIALMMLGAACSRDGSSSKAAGLPPSPVGEGAAEVPASRATSAVPPPPRIPAPSPAQQRALQRALGVQPAGGEGDEMVAEVAVPGEKETISGIIALPPAKRSKVSRGDTIFLAARRAGGPPGPGSMLAVQKLSADDFPLRFTISGGDAMIPGVPFEGRMSITARVDKDGDAMTRQRGDVFGQVKDVAVGTQDVVISLDSEPTEDTTLAAPAALERMMLPTDHP